MAGIHMFEILMVCLVSGCGMIYSGHILHQWRMNETIHRMDSLWTLITPLLGLKGNLEMTLASRLSTQAKVLGINHSFKMATTNLIITQIQGLIVGLGASILVTLLNVLSNFETVTLMFYQFIRLSFIGVLTASTACLILGSVTIVIVYGSSRLHYDPDNIASPLAAALGDTVTLLILYFYVTLCPSPEEVSFRHFVALLFIFAIFFPWLLRKVRSKEDKSILRTCWFAIVPAMILSSFSGFVLKMFVFRIKFLATLQPLVNGVGGNVASILCSSMSTDCHKSKKDGFKPKHSNLLVFLIFISIFTHVFLLIMGNATGVISLPGFQESILPYFFAVVIQTIFLLYFMQFLVVLLWKNGIDPDNSSIPFATGFGDIIGTCLLCICLYV